MPLFPQRRRVLLIVAVVVLLGLQAGLLAYSATRHSPTMLEPAQLAAGISNWEFGRFELFRVNPPLVRMIAALPVLAAGCETDWTSFYESPGARPEFAVGSDFVAANGERSIWLFTIARWACIPLATAGGLFCFFWSRELWSSNAAGLLALGLWCFDPNVLAHSELITTDAAAASFGLGAAYLFWRWLKQPTWGRAGAAGMLLGLAQLSKMSWLFLFGLWPLIWVASRIVEGRVSMTHPGQSLSGDPKGSASSQQAPPVPQLAVILLLALYLLNLGYGFDGSFSRLGDYRFISSRLTGLEKSGTPGNRFADSWLAAVPVPVPKQYLLGLDTQQHDFEDFGQPSYLRGEWKDGGWWYYYLYGLWVKVPHGTQLLFLGTLAWTVWQGWQSSSTRRAAGRSPSPRAPDANSASGAGQGESRGEGPDASELLHAVDHTPLCTQLSNLSLLVLPPLILFVMVSAQLEFNHHLRYVLPCAGFAFVFMGQAGTWFQAARVRAAS